MCLQRDVSHMNLAQSVTPSARTSANKIFTVQSKAVQWLPDWCVDSYAGLGSMWTWR